MFFCETVFYVCKTVCFFCETVFYVCKTVCFLRNCFLCVQNCMFFLRNCFLCVQNCMYVFFAKLFFMCAKLYVFLRNCFCIEEETDKREGKGRCCCLGDVLECRISHLAARMIWWKVFERTSILGGWWFGVVWTTWSSIFLKHPLCQVPVLLSILFSNLSGAKYVVRHGIE